MKLTSILRLAYSPFRPDEYLRRAKQTMALRLPKPIFDVLSPMPSHLLNVSLADHIPHSCQPKHFARRLQAHNHRLNTMSGAAATGEDPGVDRTSFVPDLRCPPPTMSGKDMDDNALAMPLGHHLVYFPLQMMGTRLAPDGADPDHCPGEPFKRRLWAGGSITFSEGWEEQLRLDGRRAVCVESVGPPLLSPAPSMGSEKVSVGVVRRYGPVGPETGDEEQCAAAEQRAMTLAQSHPAIEEVRTLVFLRHGNQKEVSSRARTVKVPYQPDSSFTLVPDARLLFQFSALSFNAHAIHIDPLYAREQEGHRNILVHGPLLLALMLSLVRCALPTSSHGRVLHLLNIDYKNVAPLYVGERAKVCLRLNPEGSDDLRKKWNVWIESPDGGLVVKGTAVAIEPMSRKIMTGC